MASKPGGCEDPLDSDALTQLRVANLKVLLVKGPKPLAPKREARVAPAREARSPLQVVVNDDSGTGHCIRCGDDLDFNMDRPLCRGCFSSWKKYGDKNYAEKFCHGCGEPKKTSVARPLRRPCFDDLGDIPSPDDDNIPF